MSSFRLRERLATVDIMSTGRPGPASLYWDNAGWMSGKTYWVHAALEHGGSSFRALVEHEATAATEPGVGADWRDVWEILAARAELTQDFIDLQAAIELAASNASDAAESISQDRAAVSAAVDAFGQTAAQAVQAIGTKVVQAEQSIDLTVTMAAGSINAVVSAAEQSIAGTASQAQAGINQTASTANQGLVAAATDAEQSIAQAATTATTAIDADAAAVHQDREATAEHRRLTGLDAVATHDDASKTAADRLKVAEDAARAALYARQFYGVSIFNTDGIPAGTWIADRYTAEAVVLSTVHLELINGTGAADIYLDINGVNAAGPWTIDKATPLALTGMTIPVAKQSKISFVTSAVRGQVIEIAANTYGKYA